MTKQSKRILVLRIAVILPFVLIFSLGAFWLITSYSEDRAVEKRLLGKWELRPDTSDSITEPPVGIIEWLPNGQTNDYSPEMELWESTIDRQNSRFNWYVFNGKLYSSMRTPQTKGFSVMKFELNWQNSNNFVSTYTNESGNSVNVLYRRVVD